MTSHPGSHGIHFYCTYIQSCLFSDWCVHFWFIHCCIKRELFQTKMWSFRLLQELQKNKWQVFSKYLETSCLLIHPAFIVIHSVVLVDLHFFNHLLFVNFLEKLSLSSFFFKAMKLFISWREFSVTEMPSISLESKVVGFGFWALEHRLEIVFHALLMFKRNFMSSYSIQRFMKQRIIYNLSSLSSVLFFFSTILKKSWMKNLKI